VFGKVRSMIAQGREKATEVLMLRVEDCINETCPWSGNPVQADSLTRSRNQVVGFCNPGCRDRFEQAHAHLERARERAGKAPGHKG
jgi:hypothetical protein